MQKTVAQMKFKYRLTIFGRTILWVFFVFLALRGIASLYIHPHTKVVATVPKATKPAASNDEPVVEGHEFLSEWYRFSPKENMTTRTNRIAPFTTQSFQANYLNSQDFLSTKNVAATNIQTYQVTWIDKTHAQIAYMVHLSNNAIIYPVLQMVKSGTGWYVDKLPSLEPSPVRGQHTTSVSKTSTSAQNNSNLTYLTPTQKKQIKGTLQNFFHVYLQGNAELVSRLSKNANIQVGTVVPKGSKLTNVSFQAVSTIPLVVIADIQVQLQNTKMTLEYKVTLQQDLNELNVTKLQFS